LQGRVINPQFWPQDYDWKNDRIAVIGNGATAVSLVPALPEKAAQVTMIQRSPSYVATWDNGLSWAHKYLPLSFVYGCRRLWCAIRLQLFVFYCRKSPQAVIDFLRTEANKILPARVDYDVHFKPHYKPWDQRMCVDSDSEFFKSLSRPNVDIITGLIDTITEQGIKMQDGKTIEADTIVAATGFRMQIDGGIRMRVDGEVVAWNERFVWNGAMVSGVPNMVFMLGYPTNSWTLGVDESAFVLTRLMQHMQSRGARSVVPRVPKDATMSRLRLWDLTSTYRVAAESRLPVQGDQGPWKPRVAPVADWIHSRWGNVTTDLEFID
jgi:cation diffusion facilitator CzcD-associated flavoprotein CzcO